MFAHPEIGFLEDFIIQLSHQKEAGRFHLDGKLVLSADEHEGINLIFLAIVIDLNIPSNENHIFRTIMGTLFKTDELKVRNHVGELLLQQVANPKSYVVFSYEHFIALEDVLFPKGFLQFRESLENFSNRNLFDLNDLCHGICC